MSRKPKYKEGMVVHPGPGERVAAQAREYGHSKRRELSYLVTHSVLHLLGYDHLDEGPMKAQMRAREEAIMALLGLER